MSQKLVSTPGIWMPTLDASDRGRSALHDEGREELSIFGEEGSDYRLNANAEAVTFEQTDGAGSYRPIIGWDLRITTKLNSTLKRRVTFGITNFDGTAQVLPPLEAAAGQTAQVRWLGLPGASGDANGDKIRMLSLSVASGQNDCIVSGSVIYGEGL